MLRSPYMHLFQNTRINFAPGLSYYYPTTASRKKPFSTSQLPTCAHGKARPSSMPLEHTFVVPKRFNDTPTFINSRLLRLPNELLIIIFRLSLLLTSRRLLSLSSCIPVKLYVTRDMTCPTMEDLMERVEPLDENGRPNTYWSLCYSCATYRPRDNDAYWRCRDCIIKEEDRETALDSWRSGQDECPAC
ncbi:uncharacterized protein CIMG_07915 [Coccidioides immitis RS]|uniref:F-box domain-containing protein n=3 Tax=Coccidioides immitis TaxID=5501 RepID=J3K4E3_COCIM|nr:uncharacterized protein CIMG_07915 [Coccidioides immitis RS]EAS29169.3 hypothetical protein CIMG_07915 [Coccidioides immitis RS]KMP06290.1 hypothetical protein CIRG_05971 [Coccidioides immitis RMSCC 2394]KMU91334.1 hypothetical protein CIHG_09211 [Coccidioides immitis H538.4]